MIPTVIFVSVVVGLAIRRAHLLLWAILLIGIGWASLVSVVVDADFFAGVAFGVPNAVVGVAFGAGVRAMGEGIAAAFSRRGAAR